MACPEALSSTRRAKEMVILSLLRLVCETHEYWNFFRVTPAMPARDHAKAIAPGLQTESEDRMIMVIFLCHGALICKFFWKKTEGEIDWRLAPLFMRSRHEQNTLFALFYCSPCSKLWESSIQHIALMLMLVAQQDKTWVKANRSVWVWDRFLESSTPNLNNRNCFWSKLLTHTDGSCSLWCNFPKNRITFFFFLRGEPRTG